jgi:hypothetical protein
MWNPPLKCQDQMEKSGVSQTHHWFEVKPDQSTTLMMSFGLTKEGKPVVLQWDNEFEALDVYVLTRS